MLGTHRRWWRRLRLTLIVQWRSAELDRQLAAGMNPWRSDELALRAQRITRRRSRSQLARGLSSAVRAGQEVTGFSAAVRPDPGEVLEARTVLSAVAQRLRAPEPVAARGVAIVHVLLTDATSPLYHPVAQGALGSRLRAAVAFMEPTNRAGGVT
ncbi:MAG: hypothetical protein ACTHMY_17810 [Solirubrobacteraceae bacterium]